MCVPIIMMLFTYKVRSFCSSFIFQSAWSALHYLALGGKLECMKEVIRAGARVDAQDKVCFHCLPSSYLNRRLAFGLGVVVASKRRPRAPPPCSSVTRLFTAPLGMDTQNASSSYSNMVQKLRFGTKWDPTPVKSLSLLSSAFGSS